MAEPRPKKISTADAPVEVAPPAPVAAPTAPTYAAPPVYAAPAPRNSGLVTAAIAVGSVVVAAGLFGGGVALGVNLPHGGTAQSQHGQFGFPPGGDQNGFPSGPNGFGGPGPVMPGQGGQRQGDN
ncbi:MAG: hypothetical protein ABJB03_08095 [Rhodoglobus sp.]